MNEEERIDSWRTLVIGLLNCMSSEQINNNYVTLLSPLVYTIYKEEKDKNIHYRFGQHIWSNLKLGGLVSCPELFYEVDEEKVKDFIACFLFEAGKLLNEVKYVQG